MVKKRPSFVYDFCTQESRHYSVSLHSFGAYYRDLISSPSHPYCQNVWPSDDRTASTRLLPIEHVFTTTMDQSIST